MLRKEKNVEFGLLLRNVTKHIKDQNWFAVGIDFVIVVAGVLFALMAEQWLRDGKQRDDLARAEIAINADLLTNLFNAREIGALTPCRRERTQILSELLEKYNDQWGGIPWTPHQGAFNAQLPELLPTPYRLWGSRVWEAEQRLGTFAAMDSARRQTLDTIFAGTNVIIKVLEDIVEAQSRLKVLAIAKEISPSDRTRYLELLHFVDEQTGMLELMAQQTLEQIESFGFRPDQSYIEEYDEYMSGYGTARKERYGDCFVPFDMPFLDSAVG
ncbi:MAG: hypothetical protein ACI9UU_001172 [Candidatus Azotimanducaceae bacterium]|jgi:hypothetical protein